MPVVEGFEILTGGYAGQNPVGPTPEMPTHCRDQGGMQRRRMPGGEPQLMTGLEATWREMAAGFSDRQRPADGTQT